MSQPPKVRKPPVVFFTAMLRGVAARQFEQVFVSSGLKQKQGSGGWAAGNRHQSLSDQLPHPVDLKRLLKVGAAVRCAPVVVQLERIENRNAHWALKLGNGKALDPLLDAMRHALVEYGFEQGKRNTPHVTLHYRPPFALEKPVLFEPIEWRIDEFQLVRSTGHGVTYHYEQLGSWSLDGEPEPLSTQQALI